MAGSGVGCGREQVLRCAQDDNKGALRTTSFAQDDNERTGWFVRTWLSVCLRLLLGGNLAGGGEFGEGAVVFFAAEGGEGGVGGEAGAVDGAKRAVGDEGVGGGEGEVAGDVVFAGGGEGILDGEDEAGDGPVGGVVLGPIGHGVFDGHGIEVVLSWIWTSNSAVLERK